MVSKDTNDIITHWQLKEATVREVQYKYRSDSETQNSLLRAVKNPTLLTHDEDVILPVIC